MRIESVSSSELSLSFVPKVAFEDDGLETFQIRATSNFKADQGIRALGREQ